MSTCAFPVDEALRSLGRTPAVIHALLRDLPEGAAERREGPGTWTIRDVVAHLADCETGDWLRRVDLMIDLDSPVLPPVDRERFRDTLAPWSAEQLGVLFQERRSSTVAFLGPWLRKPGILERTARHPAFGEVSIAQLVGAWVVHDHTHVAQIVRVMAHGFRKTVGPWSRYLSILHELERRPQAIGGRSR